MEEDRFEKTANELEEVLKRKFPDVSPPKATSQKSQSVLKPTLNTKQKSSVLTKTKSRSPN